MRKLLNNSVKDFANESSAVKGIPAGKLHTFIDRNAMRYIDTFSQNKDFKRFTTKNYAAFFFPELWLLYRKMFLYALLKAITSILLCVMVFYVSIAVMTPKINEIISSDDEVIVTIPEHIKEYDDWVIDSYVEEYERRNSKDTRLSAIFFGIDILTTASLIIYNFIFSRYADCIYRGYIVKNSHKKGGVSFVAVIIPVALSVIILVYKTLGFDQFLLNWT